MRLVLDLFRTTLFTLPQNRSQENKEDEEFKKRQQIGNSNKIVCATTRSRVRQQNESLEITRDDILPLKEQQRNDPVLKFIIEAKERDFRPEWSDISAMKDSMKYYWQRWDSLVKRWNFVLQIYDRPGGYHYSKSFSR